MKRVYHPAILVADDDEINKKVIIRILETHDHEVTVASNGLEAMNKAQERRFDLILMDIHMPLMGGLEATARIREHEREHGIPHCPIIAVTAYATPGSQEMCTAAGLDGHLSKPINRHSMIQTIETCTRCPSR